MHISAIFDTYCKSMLQKSCSIVDYRRWICAGRIYCRRNGFTPLSPCLISSAHDFVCSTQVSTLKQLTLKIHFKIKGENNWLKRTEERLKVRNDHRRMGRTFPPPRFYPKEVSDPLMLPNIRSLHFTLLTLSPSFYLHCFY